MTWTGFYAGVNGGYGWSADTTLNGTAQAAAACASTAASTSCSAIVSGSGTNTFSSDGEFGGGQIGFNWQLPGGGFVFGVEADIQGSALRNSSTIYSLLVPVLPSSPAGGCWR